MSALSNLVLSPSVPPLREGDRLSAAEFERRYDAMPDLKKAELLDGVVYMGSPVSTLRHGSPHSLLLGWLVNYWVATPGTLPSDNGTVRIDDKNVPQPDALLMIQREGHSRLDERGYVAGGPELVAEVAGGRTDSILREKKKTYRRAGIREYILWHVEDGEVEWFSLNGSRYVKLRAGRDGIHRSIVFPGLWLDVAALVRIDGPEVMRVLSLGLVSPEHAAFVLRLRENG
jgi:Uma2 family endonuclease